MSCRALEWSGGIMDFRKKFLVRPGGKIKLADIDPAYKGTSATKPPHPRSHATSKVSPGCNTSSTPRASDRFSSSYRASMRREKTASFVTSSAAPIRKASM
jgi:hypothetical protein